MQNFLLSSAGFVFFSSIGMRLSARNGAHLYPCFGEISKTKITQSEIYCGYYSFPQCPSAFTTSQFFTRPKNEKRGISNLIAQNMKTL